MTRPEFHLFPSALQERYLPKRKLGRGAMGQVYLALDRRTDRLVAVKTLPPTSEEVLERRLVREAVCLQELRHPNVLRVLAHGKVEGTPYLVSEYLRGRNLADRSLELDLVRVAQQASEGLQAVHEAGLLHRDVKPANLFVTNRGRVVLMDFGLVFDPKRTSITDGGGMLGTLNYMAPECLQGKRPDQRSDWYSLTATLLYLLRKRPPFTRVQLVGAVANEERLVASLDDVAGDHPLRPILEAGLSWQPEQRPVSGEAFRALLPD